MLECKLRNRLKVYIYSLKDDDNDELKIFIIFRTFLKPNNYLMTSWRQKTWPSENSFLHFIQTASKSRREGSTWLFPNKLFRLQLHKQKKQQQKKHILTHPPVLRPSLSDCLNNHYLQEIVQMPESFSSSRISNVPQEMFQRINHLCVCDIKASSSYLKEPDIADSNNLSLAVKNSRPSNFWFAAIISE